MLQPDVIIYDALRTPRGKGKPAYKDKPGGALSSVAPHRLVVDLIEGLAKRNQGLIENVESLTLGCVGQVGAQGGHIAHVSKLASLLSNDIPAHSLNNFCVSGLSAVAAAARMARSNTNGLHLAGGVESLSHVSFLADGATYYSDPELREILQWAPPIMGAELIATLEGFTKQDLDEISLRSHQLAAKAWRKGHYQQSVMPIKSDDGDVLLNQDELIRKDLSASALAEMAPAFAAQGAEGFDEMMLQHSPQLDAINHVHSIGNCPGMADGAALVLLGDEHAGKKAGVQAKARIVAMIEAADDPVLQLTGGLKAIDQLFAQSQLALTDMDRIEFMEAFAAVPLKFIRDFDVDMDKFNVNGGHLAMGHPLGATGGILITSLVHELERSDGQFGLVAAQAGGGIGAAMIIERLPN